MKYCTKPTPAFKEYTFTFNSEHLAELKTISEANPKTFVALVCVKDCQICCLKYSQIMSLINMRKEKAGIDEAQYTIIVTAPSGKGLRTYVNEPGRRKRILGKEIIVARKAFPDILFE